VPVVGEDVEAAHLQPDFLLSMPVMLAAAMARTVAAIRILPPVAWRLMARVAE